jgi:hypothetical protein
VRICQDRSSSHSLIHPDTAGVAQPVPTVRKAASPNSVSVPARPKAALPPMALAVEQPATSALDLVSGTAARSTGGAALALPIAELAASLTLVPALVLVLPLSPLCKPRLVLPQRFDLLPFSRLLLALLRLELPPTVAPLCERVLRAQLLRELRLLWLLLVARLLHDLHL